MLRFMSILPIALISTSVFADLPGFQNDDVKSIYYLVEIHNQLLKDGEVVDVDVDHPGNTVFWLEHYADISGERIVEFMKKQEENPGKIDKPDAIRHYAHGVITNIDNHIKQVVIQSFDRKNLGNYFLPFHGRLYDGLYLMDLAERFHDKLTDVNGQDVLILGKPYLDLPAAFTFDKNKRVVGIESKQELRHVQESIEWATTGNNFLYPKTIETITESKNNLFTQSKAKITIHDVRLNINLKDNLFAIDYPDSYEVKDLRKTLRPPSVLNR